MFQFKETPHNCLSLGAGVQSSVMALMAAKGEIKPMPDFAIFADTQAEPASVYKWLDWLEGELPFPVYKVTFGNLTENSLKPIFRKKDTKNGRAGTSYMKAIIPKFGLKNGKQVASIGRACTQDYKIKPIKKKIKEVYKIKPRSELLVTQWIGISYDEIQRIKESRDGFMQNRYPLVEMRMHRHDCLAWMTSNKYPVPPRSACIYCPFHSDKEWRRLRNEEPEEFAKAVSFDKKIRSQHAKFATEIEMSVFLHRSCKPLDEVDFDSDEDKGQQTWDFKAECEGMCGV